MHPPSLASLLTAAALVLIGDVTAQATAPRAKPQPMPAARATPSKPSPTPSRTVAPDALYNRLGAKPGMTKLATQLVAKLSADSRLMKNERIKTISKSINRPQVTARLAERLCYETDGPCVRPKQDILEPSPATKGFELQTFEWLYVMEDSNAAMQAAGVGATEQMELLNLLLAARDRE